VIGKRSQGFYIVRLPFIIVAICGLFLPILPADAGQLKTWQLSGNGRKLSFRTDGGVQPRATLLFSPTRLVIDLPATSFPRPTITQKLSGYYTTLRVGQFDGNTTRLVLEVRQGYTLNPKQISFTGLNPIDWVVDIPNPTVGNTPNL
jgi:N-acetylmuramoyl-L-alanine amidase